MIIVVYAHYLRGLGERYELKASVFTAVSGLFFQDEVLPNFHKSCHNLWKQGKKVSLRCVK